MLKYFLAPSALWWALVIPLVVILYFLKLKRQEVVFPSTLLWQRVIEDLRVNSPFQKLKNNLLLILQVILLILLILAIARPFLETKTTHGQDIIVLMDISASMQAKDQNAVSRLESAKEQALKLVEDLSSEDRMMIVSFARKTKIEQTFTKYKSRLREVIASLESVDMNTNLQEALTISQTMLERASAGSIYVITDAAIEDLDSILEKDLGKFPPQFVIVGEKSDNVGILAFDVRPDPGKKTYQAFVQLENFGDSPVEGYLQIFLNGDPIEEDIRLVRLAQKGADPGSNSAGYSDGILFKNLQLEEGIIEVRFSMEKDKGNDYLETDNRAWFVVPPLKKTKLCLVTPGSYPPFLEQVLQAHDPELRVLAPEEYEKIAKESDIDAFTKDYDLIVFEKYTPENPVPAGQYLLFNCVPQGISEMQNLGVLTSSNGRLRIIDQKDLHPAMRFINLRKIGLGKAMKLTWPEETLPLLETESQTLIGIIQRKDHLYTIVGFDILQSDWPVEPSFPIFVSNVIRWMQTSKSKQNVLSGDIFRVRVNETQKTLKIVDTKGKENSYDVNDASDFLFSHTDQVGIYKILVGDTPEQNLAVNLFSDSESAIAPRKEIKVEGKNLAKPELKPINREIWWYLVLAGFVFLILEWIAYNRRSLFFKR